MAQDVDIPTQLELIANKLLEGPVQGCPKFLDFIQPVGEEIKSIASALAAAKPTIER